MTRCRTGMSLRFAILVALTALHGQVAAQDNALSVTKTFRTVSDPLRNPNPRNIPGAVVDYSIAVQNTSFTRLARDTVLIDSIPANTELRVDDLPLLSAVSIIGGIPVVSDLTTVTAGPVDFQGTALLTGVEYTFRNLGDATDSIDFSSDNRATWTYRPVRNGDGYDPAVTDIRIRFFTGQNPRSSYSVRFRVRVR